MKNNKKMPFADFREAVKIPEDYRTNEHFFYDRPIVVDILEDIEKVVHAQFVLANPEKTFFGKAFVRKLSYELDEREKLFIKTKVYDDWGRKVVFTRHFYFVSKMDWGLENLLNLNETED